MSEHIGRSPEGPQRQTGEPEQAAGRPQQGNDEAEQVRNGGPDKAWHGEPASPSAMTEPIGTGATGTAGSGTGATGTGPAGIPAGAVRPRRGIRVRTLVFGLVLLAISASVLVTLMSTVQVDATAVALVVLIGAGAALIAGGLAAAVREARGGPGG